MSESKPKLCFVVGPIGQDGSDERKHADMLLNAIIKDVLRREEFNYVVRRADEDTNPGMINDRVITDVTESDLVVADLTDLNPNAFYELGIRHSIEKPTIHIAKIGTKLPFDNSGYRTIFVDVSDWNSIESARQNLAKMVRVVEAPGYKVSNPITQANASFHMRSSADPRDQVLASVMDRLSKLEKDYSTKSDATGSELNSFFRSVIGTRIAKSPDMDENPERIWTNPRTHEIRIGDNYQELSPEEFDIFSMLYNRKGKTISKKELYDYIHKNNESYNIDKLENVVNKLNEKISIGFASPRIVRWGDTYMLYSL